jgi:hypothetical protein
MSNWVSKWMPPDNRGAEEVSPMRKTQKRIFLVFIVLAVATVTILSLARSRMEATARVRKAAA